MLKLICSLMVILSIFSSLYLTKVESRALHQNYDGVPASQFHHVRFNKRRSIDENHHDTDQNEYVHNKRKSDFLLSLYGLPYTLINRRAFS
ncbi:unnamed protein product [Adineta steineri]|uniref:Uncharacterized protein n=1 Tax=Adineta steineri TaxID=433720 RepID=A0A815S146_9BILA|nr:unnamed protein product [Adineta steineri]CAF1639791.1 unnamed protein product [Adineta steineri]